jgi:hypothetical protein
MNVTEILAARKEAGQRYTAAVQQFKAALIELASFDRVTRNGHVAAHLSNTPAVFGGEWHQLSTRLGHPEFLPESLGDWSEVVRIRADAILSKFAVA